MAQLPGTSTIRAVRTLQVRIDATLVQANGRVETVPGQDFAF